MKAACFILSAGCYLFVRPGAMGDSTLQQRAVTKIVSEGPFEQVQVRQLNYLFLQNRYICSKAGSVVEVSDKASGS